ncbi:MAG TPA: regulatory protein RecX [Bryobacteraceae bacterium]
MNGKKLDAEGLWQYALKTLARRAHSADELRRKLARRAASEQDARAAIAKIAEYGLADDRRFAENFSSSRLQNDGFGKMRILRDLRLRNVPAKIAEDAVRKTFDGIDEQDLIAQFLERKYRGKNLPELLSEPKHLASAYRRLRMAGFSSGGAVAMLKRYAAAADELSDPEPE